MDYEIEYVNGKWSILYKIYPVTMYVTGTTTEVYCTLRNLRIILTDEHEICMIDAILAILKIYM